MTEIVSADLLQKVAATATPKPTKQVNGQRFDLDSFLSRHGIDVKREQPWSTGQRRLILEHCPFNSDHVGTSAAIVQFEDGAVAFKCHHNGCATKTWTDLREQFEPGYQERKRISIEGGQILENIHQLNTKQHIVNENDEPPVTRLVEDSVVTAFPESAWTGLFANWRDIVAVCTEASLESLWATFLSATGLMIGRKAWRCTPRALYPNFFILVLGKTGDSRKSTIIWLGSEFLHRVGEDFKSIEGIVSTEGLIESLAGREETKALIYSDEFRSLLAVARRKGTQDILPRLNSLYYCPEKSSVDRVKNPTLAIRPFVSLITATPEEYVQDLLSDLDISGGFINRFIIVTGDEQAPKPIVKTPSNDAWDTLAMRAQAAIDKVSGQLEFSSDALARWRDFYIDWRNRRQKLDYRKAQLTARIFEHILKIATVYTVLDSRDVISLDTLNIAIDLGSWLESNTMRLFTEVGMDRFGKCEHTVLDLLKRSRNMRMWRRDLQMQMSGRRFNAEMFNRALKALEMNDQISCYDLIVAGKTRTVVQYLGRHA